MRWVINKQIPKQKGCCLPVNVVLRYKPHASLATWYMSMPALRNKPDSQMLYGNPYTLNAYSNGSTVRS